jgi:N-acetylneuraminate synthase
MQNEINPSIEIDARKIGLDYPTYFIADIAANHDGDLSRAIDLIYLAAESGADVAKFQHFTAETIVSDYGFRNLKSGMSHQEKWKKSVIQVYDEASVRLDWTEKLVEACRLAGITFFTSPYSIELVNYVDQYVAAYKIGSGDITWHEMIETIAEKGKPYILASGASTLEEVQKAVNVGYKKNKQLALLQCNTNYTASLENFHHIQLRVLTEYSNLFPQLVLGLSDHTPGHATVLGSVALGARIIEKHFTDDTDRDGPDHRFAMDATTWREMVERTRELEYSLGTGEKKIEANESETVVVQRRAIRTTRAVKSGNILGIDDLTALRPCPSGALPPYELEKLIGKTINRDIEAGDIVVWSDLA